MSWFRMTDPDYLRGQQYRDSSNLAARANLHQHFSTNPQRWPRWVFEQIGLAPGMRVLELGCGTAALWQENRDRLPDDCAITLSDFSIGMLRTARKQLGALAARFDWEMIDAQAIPHATGTFDVVIANHMLYHVPDRARAISEIQRVLRDGGRLYAATNGAAHMRELDDLLSTITPKVQRTSTGSHFTLENGAQQLARSFATITVTPYPDALDVPVAEPLIQYILSTSATELLDDQRLARLHSVIDAEITAHGSFHITKSVGLFTAQV
jgi:ubiquinone/menaquinone biosynthesis C-methylase UbiE